MCLRSRERTRCGTAIVVDDAVSSDPVVHQLMRVIDAGPELSSPFIMIDPERLDRKKAPGKASHLDQLADQSARRTEAAITNSQTLLLGTTRATLYVADLDRPGLWTLQTIDGQRLAAFDLEPCL